MPEILAYLSINDRFAALGNFGAWPNPPFVGSPRESKLTAASSSIDLSSFDGVDIDSVFLSTFRKFSAATSTSCGFSLQA